MIRKFTNISCIYFNDNNYIPARYSCPDLEFDDVILKLTTNAEHNYEKISEFLVDYAFALFCSKSDNRQHRLLCSRLQQPVLLLKILCS